MTPVVIQEIILFGGIQVDHLRHGNSDAYIVKLRAPLTSIIPIQNGMSLKVYPNPSHDSIHVSNERRITSYQIYDKLGQLILSKSIHHSQADINIQSLPFGNYFLVVSLESGLDISVPISVVR